MINKKLDKSEEKILSVLEIFILVTSVLTFSYFIGEEFKVVSTASSSSPIPSFEAGTVAVTTAGAIATVKLLKLTKASWTSIAANAGIALTLYYGTYYLLTGLFGTDEAAAEEFAEAITLGYGIGGLVSLIPGFGGGISMGILGTIPVVGIIGAGVGIAWWIFFGTKEQETWAVQYTCNPWQPQTGGENCDRCNKGDLPCTEYKCESLGASCILVNSETENKACTWENRNDVTPPTISAWEEALSEGYEYAPYTATYPGDSGVEIKYTGSTDGCAPAFSKITYGVALNKLGRCKIDSVRKSNFSDMTQVINFDYKENHTMTSLHGGVAELEDEGIPLTNGGKYEIFVRCESTNGRSQVGNFVFKYCVQEQPDTTAPTIELIDPPNKWPIESGKTSQEIIVYTDKPSDCKWSHNDESYADMANTMTCSQSILEMNANTYYPCTTTLTGLKDETENVFYLNCESYPLKEGTDKESERRIMTKNVKYTLVGTQPLVIDSITPEQGTLIKDSTESVQVTLTAKTSAGHREGSSVCSYKETAESETKYTLFQNTNSYEHSQTLWLDEGSYEYSVKCCDIAELTGNCDEEFTYFEIETDFEEPLIIRAYNENAQLKIITNEGAECVYDTNDCSYNFEDGLKLTTTNSKEHFAEWDTNNNFYIKCRDEFGNKPNPDECSITARAFTSY